MRKVFKPLACIFSIIATILMLIGIIYSLIGIPVFSKAPHLVYFSAINFILFAILFHFAGEDTEKKA
ncbi:MAG: hypothetical protein WCI48_14700 [Bacteroidota bacterium]|jgi:hypothetical protein